MDVYTAGNFLLFFAFGGAVLITMWGLYKLDNWMLSRPLENEDNGGSDGRCFTCAVRVMAVEYKWRKRNKELKRQQQLVLMLKEEYEVIRRRAIAAEAFVICHDQKREISFGCGHTACEDCASIISICYICREPISIRTRVFL